MSVRPSIAPARIPWSSTAVCLRIVAAEALITSLSSKGSHVLNVLLGGDALKITSGLGPGNHNETRPATGGI